MNFGGVMETVVTVMNFHWRKRVKYFEERNNPQLWLWYPRVLVRLVTFRDNRFNVIVRLRTPRSV